MKLYFYGTQFAKSPGRKTSNSFFRIILKRFEVRLPTREIGEDCLSEFGLQKIISLTTPSEKGAVYSKELRLWHFFAKI